MMGFLVGLPLGIFRLLFTLLLLLVRLAVPIAVIVLAVVLLRRSRRTRPKAPGNRNSTARYTPWITRKWTRRDNHGLLEEKRRPLGYGPREAEEADQLVRNPRPRGDPARSART